MLRTWRASLRQVSAISQPLPCQQAIGTPSRDALLKVEGAFADAVGEHDHASVGELSTDATASSMLATR